MNELKEIRDDQIRILGEPAPKGPRPRGMRPLLVGLVLAILLGGILIVRHLRDEHQQTLRSPEPALFEPEAVAQAEPLEASAESDRIGRACDSLKGGFTEIRDTLINDIPLRIYIPHNAELTLHIGRMNKEDREVIYAAQAADVRADNGGIVGAFVLKGVPRAWGLSKSGFCASINGKVTIGVAENSPLFEQATEQGGYFFRQYPLVSQGKIVENKPKGKAIRRAICDRRGEIFMVESGTPESLHDFSQALVDLGVDQGIYLVGSSAYGWAVDQAGTVHEFGEDNFYSGRRRMPRNTSYIVWRRSTNPEQK